MLAAWGRFVFAHRVRVLVICGLFLAVALAVFVRGGTLTTGTIRGIEAQRAADLVDTALGKRAGPSFIAIFHSPTLTTDDPEFFEKMGNALAPLDDTPEVASVLSPVEAPPQLGNNLISADKHRAIAIIVFSGSLNEAAEAFPGVRAKIKPGDLDLQCTGTLLYHHDVDTTLKHDLLIAEIVSLPLALFVLLFVFRSAVAALLPVGVGALSVMGGLASVMLLSRTMDMPKYTINVASLIGLGVAIDYSLFFVSRFREELKKSKDTESAIARSMETSGRAVLFSGLAVGIGLLGLLFFPHSYLSSMGLGGVLVVVFAIVFALTFLPALLSVLGPRIDAWALPFGQKKEDESKNIWHRLAPWVMDRPVRILIPTLAIVLSLGVPFFHLRLTAQSEAILPKTTEARAGYEILHDEFPTQALTRIQVIVTFPSEAITVARAQAIRDLRDRLSAMPDVMKVESVFDFDPTLPADQAVKLVSLPAELRPIDVATAMEFTTGHGSTILTIITPVGGSSDRARDMVRQLRTDRAVADGSLIVGGRSAMDVDSTDFMVGHTPAAIAFIVSLTYVVLFFLLGSVLLPLKAVVMNFLSIAGSFGALVFIFQDGHLASLLRFEPGPIEPTLPPLLFCVVFGLSMDYEVLLLSRIHEEYAKHHDNRRAVTEGLAQSGRLITSAAAIMVAVFAAYALATIVVVKAMGVGMTVAVTLDATLVRLLIVPATMRLFGDMNWWAPKFLARLLARTSHHET